MNFLPCNVWFRCVFLLCEFSECFPPIKMLHFCIWKKMFSRFSNFKINLNSIFKSFKLFISNVLFFLLSLPGIVPFVQFIIFSWFLFKNYNFLKNLFSFFSFALSNLSSISNCCFTFVLEWDRFIINNCRFYPEILKTFFSTFNFFTFFVSLPLPDR